MRSTFAFNFEVYLFLLVFFSPHERPKGVLRELNLITYSFKQSGKFGQLRPDQVLRERRQEKKGTRYVRVTVMRKG